MNQTREHTLSSWIDDEISPSEADRLLVELAADDELKRKLGRYHLASDCLRGEPVRIAGLEIADRVGRALNGEPPVLAPRPRGRERRLVRYVGGGAIAASVALVAVLSLSDDPRVPTEEPITVARAPVERPILDASTAPPSALASSVIEQQQVESRLDRILAEHTEYAGSGGMQGILPYTTFVSYDVR